MDMFERWCRVLMVASVAMPSLAFADQILDRVEIVQTETEADIHIEFLTQVRYLRHFPMNESDRIQIFLDFPELKGGLPTEREFRSSPASDIVPSFTVNFPDQTSNSLAIKFSKPVKFRVSPDSSGRGLILHVLLEKQAIQPEVKSETQQAPVAEEKPSAIDSPAIPAGMSMEEYTGKLMADGRTALDLGDYSKATQLFNALLNLPPHSHSQDALELVGQAREKNGELAKAKAEYDLYLKLYPEGDGAARVRQRLAAVDEAKKVADLEPAKEKKPVREIHENTVFGSWNQYYYDAHTSSRGLGTDTRTHDQSALISNLDITGRFRHNQYDSRIVFRDTQIMDFLPGERHEDRNRVRAAYFELENKDADYMFRLGRQSGNFGGILGRFDGALLRYGLTPNYRVNLVAGALDERNVDYKRYFYGVNLDIGPFAEKWSGNAYFINQEVDGIADRRAIGGELRYFDTDKYFYSHLDFDMLYKQVNIATFQGNWKTESGINFNLLADHRKTAILQLTNGLFAVPGAPTSVRGALDSKLVTREELRDFAQAQTADSDLLLVGVERQMTKRWLLSGDIRVNRISGLEAAGVIPASPDGVTPASPVIPASPGSGVVWTYTAQAIGLDTLFQNDTTIVNASYSEAPASKMYSLALSNVVVPQEKWRVNSYVRLSRLEGDPSITSNTVASALRVAYQLRERMTIEAEVGLELNNTKNQEGSTNSLGSTAFIGYRWDF